MEGIKYAIYRVVITLPDNTKADHYGVFIVGLRLLVSRLSPRIEDAKAALDALERGQAEPTSPVFRQQLERAEDLPVCVIIENLANAEGQPPAVDPAIELELRGTFEVSENNCTLVSELRAAQPATRADDPTRPKKRPTP